jgi:hypothetical protein
MSGQKAAVMLPPGANASANKPRLLTLAYNCLRPADRLDYTIRKLVIPPALRVDQTVSPAALSVADDRRHMAASMQSRGLLSEVQTAIGEYLRAEYDLAQSVPSRLLDLVRQVEQTNGEVAPAIGAT